MMTIISSIVAVALIVVSVVRLVIFFKKEVKADDDYEGSIRNIDGSL